MNVENESAEPETDLRLSLGNSDNTSERRVNNDSGAGANAASNMDMMFVATDPLSELVWSPQRGLCLRCTGRSIFDEKPSHLSGAGAGPSNVLSPSRVVSSNKRTDEDSFGKSVFHPYNKVSNIEAFQSLSCCAEIGRASSAGDEGKKEARKVEGAQTELPQERSDERTRYIDDQENILKPESLIPLMVHGENKTEAAGLKGPREESTLFKEGETAKAMKTDQFSSHGLSEKVETTAENDFPSTVNRKSHIDSRTFESDNEVKRKSQLDEVNLQWKKVSSKDSLTNSRIKLGEKCKEKNKKALSDGNSEGRAPEYEDDSHESVESCNSAGIFRTGKRKWSFEQQLIVGSKRVKQQIIETPSSSPFIKHDSSFMNWISNLVKGSAKEKLEVPSLMLTLPDCNQGLENPHLDLITSNGNTHTGFQNTGFRSIFHSIYSPKIRVQEPRAPDENDMLEPDTDCNVCETDATPVVCNGENVQLGEIFPLPEDSEAGSGNQVQVPPPGGIKSNGESCPEENGVSNNVACAAQKDRTSSSSSMGKFMVLAAVNMESDPPSEVKGAYDVSYRSNPLGNPWITRFIPNILLNKDVNSQTTSQISEFPNDITVSGQQGEEKPLTGSNEELKCFKRNIEASADFSKIKNKLDSFRISPRLTNSEAMASLFARRLDALKHMVSFGVPEDAAHISATCFFCGKIGHLLRDCSEITETDLEDLVSNTIPCNGVEGLPCLCIRCYQLNHWAVSCPNSSSGVRSRGKRKCDEEDLRSYKNYQAAITQQTVCRTLDTRTWGNLNHLMNADKTKPSTELQETFKASSSRIVKPQEGFLSRIDMFTGQKLLDMPKGILDAIKKLRLSRTDIFRWMSSQMTLSILDGFFVRLRLGKWQEGIPRTGYCVACINGTEENEDLPDASSKSCILVNVAGVKVLVESQYISNHDFLEDELEAWWSATQTSCHTIPSEEALRNKMKEKRMLGL